MPALLHLEQALESPELLARPELIGPIVVTASEGMMARVYKAWCEVREKQGHFIYQELNGLLFRQVGRFKVPSGKSQLPPAMKAREETERALAYSAIFAEHPKLIGEGIESQAEVICLDN